MNHTDASALLSDSPAYEESHKTILQEALDALKSSNIDPDVQDLIRSQMFA